MTVGLGLDLGLDLGLVFCLFGLSILCIFCSSLFFVLFAFVVLHLVSSVLCQDIGWEERLRNDLLRVEWDVRPYNTYSLSRPASDGSATVVAQLRQPD